MATSDRAAEISAEGICKTFGSFAALSDVSLTIARGEFLTLLGPSGSGKTTFLMVLAGFEAPTAGRLLRDGLDITAQAAEERAFGMVFQGYALFPHMTVTDNIAFPLRVQRRPGAEIRARVGAMIELVGLTGHERKRPGGLSGGQQQRVALARALIYEPPVLLLDEPFSALDKNLRGQMQEEVRRLHRDTGTTFVFVTHDQSEALALSTRIAIFEKGRLQQLAAPRSVYERPSNRFVAEFLGEVNLLPVTEVDRSGGRVRARFEGRSVAAGGPGGERASHLAIRPEYMQLHAAAPAAGNVLRARVRDATYLGAQTRLAAVTETGVPITLTVQTAALGEGLVPGAEVWASWPEGRGFML